MNVSVSSSAVPRYCKQCGGPIPPSDVAMWKSGNNTSDGPYHAACYPHAINTSIAHDKRLQSLEARVQELERLMAQRA